MDTTRSDTALAAVDLGASSGRVIVARVGPGRLDLHEAARFPNDPRTRGSTLRWDFGALERGVLDGLRTAARHAEIASVGIDSWAVDYGLLDADGRLIADPVHYRDSRTGGGVERVQALVGPEELYELTGVQFQPFNTVYQLMSDPDLSAARTLLLIPDLLAHRLTGVAGAEQTNASTTQLYDPERGTWATALMRRLGIPSDLFPPIREPGDPIGPLLPDIAATTGLGPGVHVTAVASHDTASAVAAVPAEGEHFAYISCGTWSLVGVELDAPVRTDAARAANFTNEIGLGGTVRFLRNVAGLWPLQECARAYGTTDLPRLLARAGAAPALRSVIDLDDPALRAPGDMPARIARACERAGEPVPRDRAETVRCVLDSLALAHRVAVEDAQRLSGRHADAIHMVGGGSANELLCRLTADACGLPVLAGPVEATAIGNIGVQAAALGLLDPDPAAVRALIRATRPPRRHDPSGDTTAWERARRRTLRTSSDEGERP